MNLKASFGLAPHIVWFSTVAMIALGLGAWLSTGALADTPPVVVLDTSCFWRMHNVLCPPVIQKDSGPEPILFQMTMLDTPTPPPPTDWTKVDCDDSGWTQAVPLRFAKTPYLSRLCLRGKFEVTNPAQVSGLSLDLAYYGGAVVYLNGEELKRGHLPAGLPSAETLAEVYGEEAFVTAAGEFFPKGSRRSPEDLRRRP